MRAERWDDRGDRLVMGEFRRGDGLVIGLSKWHFSRKTRQNLDSMHRTMHMRVRALHSLLPLFHLSPFMPLPCRRAVPENKIYLGSLRSVAGSYGMC